MTTQPDKEQKNSTSECPGVRQYDRVKELTETE